MIKTSITNNDERHCASRPPERKRSEGLHPYFCGILAKNALCEFNHEEASHKFNLRGIIENNGPVS